jgi:hypothetical protein
MKKLWIGILAVSCIPLFAHAAISFDASSSVAVGTTATTTITIGSGTNRMLIITAVNGASGATGTTVSVNGTDATLLFATSTAARSCAIFYYPAPPSGVVNVSSSNPTASSWILASSYAGVNQSTPFDVTTSGSVGSPTTNATITITTTVANDWLVDAIARVTLTGFGASQTLIATSSQGGGDSYQPTTAAGSYSDTYTFSNGVYIDCLAAMEPAGGAAPATSTQSMVVLDGGRCILDGGSSIIE